MKKRILLALLGVPPLILFAVWTATTFIAPLTIPLFAAAMLSYVWGSVLGGTYGIASVLWVLAAYDN